MQMVSRVRRYESKTRRVRAGDLGKARRGLHMYIVILKTKDKASNRAMVCGVKGIEAKRAGPETETETETAAVRCAKCAGSTEPKGPRGKFMERI